MPKLLQLHLIVFLLAVTAIIGQLVDLPAPSLMVWRTVLAALAAGLWVIFVHRRSILPPRGSMFAMMGVGLVVPLSLTPPFPETYYVR